MEKLAADEARRVSPAAEPAGPGDKMPAEYWTSLLADCRFIGRPGVADPQQRLSEITGHVLRVSCRRCERIIEIQTVDAVRLYGGNAVWKAVGQRLLDDTCRNRTGSHEDDGCWPSYVGS